MPYVIEYVKLQFLQKNERGKAQMIQCFYCDNWYHHVVQEFQNKDLGSYLILKKYGHANLKDMIQY